MSVEAMQKVGAMTATFSVRENKPKYVKSTYVPPHQRNSTVSKFENNKNGGKKHTEYTQLYKPQKKTNSWTNRSNNGSWRSSGEESNNNTKQATDSPFRSWNKKEQLKKEKAEKVIIKPHCELFLTNLPPAMRSIAGLAAFFHPYGEVAQIQMIAPNDDIPEAVMKWCKEKDVPSGHSAIVEFLTARTAKFVVGVLRKRLAQLNFRVGLIKPGLGEELTYQRTTYGDIVHQPSSNFNQQFVVTKTHISDSSSETSEGDSRPAKRFTKRLIAPQRMSDEAYWSNPSAASSSAISSSETSMTSSDSESEQRRAASPVSEASDIADVRVLTKAMHL